MEGSDIANSLTKEEDQSKCYEASVKAEASGFGFSGSVEGGVAGCDAKALSSFSESRNSFARETTQLEVVGGDAGEDGKSFIVPPGDAVLLEETDK